jgi:hypothetical protein
MWRRRESELETGRTSSFVTNKQTYSQHTSLQTYLMYKPKPKPKTRRMIGLSGFTNLNLNLGDFYCKNTGRRQSNQAVAEQHHA